MMPTVDPLQPEAGKAKEPKSDHQPIISSTHLPKLDFACSHRLAVGKAEITARCQVSEPRTARLAAEHTGLGILDTRQWFGTLRGRHE